MRIRIEVVDQDMDKATDVIQDITYDVFDKYPEARADFKDLDKSMVELSV